MPQNPEQHPGPPPEGLILPSHAVPPKPVPQCFACKQEFEPGQLVVQFVGQVGPGALKLAPIHLGCALQASVAAAQEASATGGNKEEN